MSFVSRQTGNFAGMEAMVNSFTKRNPLLQYFANDRNHHERSGQDNVLCTLFQTGSRCLRYVLILVAWLLHLRFLWNLQ